MKIRLRKSRLSDLSCKMYYVALAIMIVTNILFVESTIEILFSVDRGIWLEKCENICWILLIFRSLILEKYDYKEALRIGFLLGLSVISMILSDGSQLLLNSILFIVASKNIDFRKIVKTVLLSNVFGVSCILFLAYTGQIKANSASLIYDGSRAVTRLSMGFSHPNYLGAHLFIICLCIVFITFHKITAKIVVLLLFLDIFIYMTCYSRTNCILIIATLIVSILANKGKLFSLNGHRFIEDILRITPVMIFIIVMFFTVFYNSNLFGTINELMSNRLRYAHEYFTKYGFSLLGQPVDFSEIEIRSYTIDCAYVYLAIRFGMIWAFLFPCMFVGICKKAIKAKRLDIVVLIVTVALWGISETYYFRIQYNFSLILMGIYIFANGNQLLEGEIDCSNEIII